MSESNESPVRELQTGSFRLRYEQTSQGEHSLLLDGVLPKPVRLIFHRDDLVKLFEDGLVQLDASSELQIVGELRKIQGSVESVADMLLAQIRNDVAASTSRKE